MKKKISILISVEKVNMNCQNNERIMYSVERFLPVECPKCQRLFKHERNDWSVLMRETKGKGYDIIVCKGCSNHTARIRKELCMFENRQDAEDLLEEGFVNLIKMHAIGYGSARQIKFVDGVLQED